MTTIFLLLDKYINVINASQSILANCMHIENSSALHALFYICNPTLHVQITNNMSSTQKLITHIRINAIVGKSLRQSKSHAQQSGEPELLWIAWDACYAASSNYNNLHNTYCHPDITPCRRIYFHIIYYNIAWPKKHSPL